jgi:aspartyl-tRNA(Asn)/glutamyl-tRNA(Gln) amidotransferase subunit A
LKAYASLREIQHDLTHGLLTCKDLVSYHLQHIQQKSHLNAFLSVYAEEAFQQATIIDHKISIGSAGKLAGLIVGLKDVIAYRDHPLQAASKILTGYQSSFNATVVDRLLKEDTIIIGRQNCDEFGMGSSNENSAFGTVINPWDETRVPGGSSGGSAVAVLADMCRVSIGSDTGGSVRQPAAFCGLIGLKPTYSRISRHGLIAYASSLDCIGIFAKEVDDVAIVLEVIAGADEYDSTVSQQPVPAYSSSWKKLRQNKYRVAYFKESNSPGNQPEVNEALRSSLNTLTDQGHSVEAIDFPMLEYALPTYYILATAEASANLSRYDGVRYGFRSEHVVDLQSLYKNTRTEAFGAEVKKRILLGTFVLSARYYDAYYTKAQQVRRLIREKTQEIFKVYDFIVSPTTPTTAFRLGSNRNNPLEMYLADLYSVYANVAGIPGINVPFGKDSGGLPIGIQVLADDFQELKLFYLADQLKRMN